jgi:hypothetical protein
MGNASNRKWAKRHGLRTLGLAYEANARGEKAPFEQLAARAFIEIRNRRRALGYLRSQGEGLRKLLEYDKVTWPEAGGVSPALRKPVAPTLPKQPVSITPEGSIVVGTPGVAP